MASPAHLPLRLPSSPLHIVLLLLPFVSLLLLTLRRLPFSPSPPPPATLSIPTDSPTTARRLPSSPYPPPPTSLPVPTDSQTTARRLPSSPSPPPPTSLPVPTDSPTTARHLLFGIASSARTLPRRLPLLRLWFRAPARGFVFLDTPVASGAPPPGLELRVSADASRFPYTYPRGLPSAVRVARIVSELTALAGGDGGGFRWVVLGDDDTAFVVGNLVATLAKYDWREWWYVGARSESAGQNARHGFGMAFGGGGIAISFPLARALATVLDSCLMRYPHLYGSDARIFACLTELGVELSHEPGFHQIDLHGDISGLLRAHPLAPLVSLHHFDHVYPLFPGMDRTKAVKHFFQAVNVDSARILQQTVCYDRSRSLTASVSWGYAVEVFEGTLLLPDALAVQRTFVPWKRSRNVSEVYMFNSKYYPRNQCKRAPIFFLKSVSSNKGKIQTDYNRQLPGKCLPDTISLRNLRLVKVTSEPMNLVPGKALRRHCCDITRPSSEFIMDISIRKCRDDELIAMHP